QRFGRRSGGVCGAGVRTALADTGDDLAPVSTGAHRRRTGVGGEAAGWYAKSSNHAPMRRERNGHMNAAVLYGREDMKIERGDIPRVTDDEVLVRGEVALTCGTDLKVWKQGFHARMIKPPALFGHELAGVVEERGRAVNGGGDKGRRGRHANSAPCNVCFYCRKGQPNLCEDLLFNNGAYAEYIRIPGRIVRQNMLEIPDGVSFVDAAMAGPLACVLRGIHEAGIKSGDTAVVIGCGPIGLKFVRVLSARGVRVI